MTGGAPLRIVAVADTDSYVKWAAATVADPHAAGELLVLDTEQVVSDGQLDAALAGAGLARERVSRARFEELADRLRGADVVLAAAPGPLVRLIARTAARLDPAPVIATGLPGISIPPTWLALHFRRQCDLFVLHSHREVREFRRLAAERGIEQRFALAGLPFARRLHGRRSSGSDLVFAAQAIVPRDRRDRLTMARVLVDVARADPSRRVVIKLRGRTGEAQTHREDDSYPDLLASIGAVPPNLVVSYAPMEDALATAAALVTVSSTAAIEAAAAGVPVVAFDEFGVGDDLINTVFLGSGLLAGRDALTAGAARHPNAQWLTDNYFHDAADDTWFDALSALVESRRAGELTPRPEGIGVGGRAREAWERRLALGNSDRTIAGRAAFAAGVPVRWALRAGRWVRNRASGAHA